MTSPATSTPNGSSERISSLASWAITPTPSGPSPRARTARTVGSATIPPVGSDPGSPTTAEAGSAPGRCTTGPGRDGSAPPEPASLAGAPGLAGPPGAPGSPAKVSEASGERPGSPVHRANTATLAVDSRADANSDSSSSTGAVADPGVMTSGSLSHSGGRPTPPGPVARADEPADVPADESPDEPSAPGRSPID